MTVQMYPSNIASCQNNAYTRCAHTPGMFAEQACHQALRETEILAYHTVAHTLYIVDIEWLCGYYRQVLSLGRQCRNVGMQAVTKVQDIGWIIHMTCSLLQEGRRVVPSLMENRFCVTHH